LRRRRNNIKLKYSLFWAIVVITSFFCASEAKNKEGLPLKVIENINLNKYMGKWYEIATIVMWFQKDCAGGTTANYELLNDGTVSVVNSCYTSNGKIKTARGIAWVVDPQTNAKLR
jgi:lipocalin